MWDKLLALFKDKPVTEDIQSVVPGVEQVSAPAPKISKSDGRSTHIGYNYLKGMDGDLEDSSRHVRRFMNLHKLLRGGYHAGKIASTHAAEEGDLRGEDAD